MPAVTGSLLAAGGALTGEGLGRQLAFLAVTVRRAPEIVRPTGLRQMRDGTLVRETTLELDERPGKVGRYGRAGPEYSLYVLYRRRPVTMYARIERDMPLTVLD
jgi:hypothetical protein